MSRSYKQPYHSITCIGSRTGMQKAWKKQSNKVLRQAKDIENFGFYKKIVDAWSAPNDGKTYNPEWKKAWRK